jgi:hypothetical protein
MRDKDERINEIGIADRGSLHMKELQGLGGAQQTAYVPTNSPIETEAAKPGGT